jgi:large subunit ribosomal protein L15
MTISLNTLKATPGSRKSTVRVGRGNASGHGTFSGRGIKGQRARSGGRKNLRKRGLKQMLMQLPKSRGFGSLQAQASVINLSVLQEKFPAKAKVTPELLLRSKLIRTKQWVKILGDGKLTNALQVSAHAFSKTAKAAIEAAGGSVTIIAPFVQPKPHRQAEKLAALAAAKK